ncbi:MAG: phosphopentomutase [Spirochaetota bacterium]
MHRVICIVLDSAGVGELPDAALYGDSGANTLGHIAQSAGLSMPECGKLGLGNIIPLNGTPPAARPLGFYGKAAGKSQGKDTTTGHWEIAGVILDEPFPLFPDGFPDEIIDEFTRRTGRKILGNYAASGTRIINDLGDEHVQTGKPIVYTSADSVFQIAAHEEVIPLEELYGMCKEARDFLPVGRVIARPFLGSNGSYTRTRNRHDFSMEPTATTMLDLIHEAGMDVQAVGKIIDIFAGRGITESVHTVSNMDGVDKTLGFMASPSRGLIFTNLVDFDMEYGHRRDVAGYRTALEQFDSRMPEIMGAMRDDDLLIITADHGCDPTHTGTDHTREYVPVFGYGRSVPPTDIGTRETYADISATILTVLTGAHRDGSFL